VANDGKVYSFGPGGLKVDGARTLRRNLKKAGVDITRLKPVHTEIAERVLAEALPHVPVRSGKLRNALKPLGTNASAIVRTTGRTVPYAAPVHWGWGTRPNKGKGWRGGPIRSDPFLWDAQERIRGDIEDTYMDKVQAVLDAIADN